MLDLTDLNVTDYAQGVLDGLFLDYTIHHPTTEAAYKAVRVATAEEADFTVVVDVTKADMLVTDDFSADHYGVLHVAMIDPDLHERIPRDCNWYYAALGQEFANYITALLYRRELLMDPEWMVKVIRKERSCQYVSAVTDLVVMGEHIEDVEMSPWEAVFCDYGHDAEVIILE